MQKSVGTLFILPFHSAKVDSVKGSRWTGNRQPLLSSVPLLVPRRKGWWTVKIITRSLGHFVTFLLTSIIILLSLPSIYHLSIDDSNAPSVLSVITPIFSKNELTIGRPPISNNEHMSMVWAWYNGYSKTGLRCWRQLEPTICAWIWWTWQITNPH